MNAAAHQVADQRKDLAMPRNGALPGERGRDKQKPVMAAIAGARMAGMEVGVVGKFEALRRQRCEPLAQQGFEIIARAGAFRLHQAGRTFLNGLTVTFW